MERFDAEPDIGTIKALHDDLCIAHPQPLYDLFAHRGRGGRRQSQDGRMAQRLNGGAEPQIIRPEIVTPLADTVRLIDDEERGLDGFKTLEYLLVAQLFGREKEKLKLALF